MNSQLFTFLIFAYPLALTSTSLAAGEPGACQLVHRAKSTQVGLAGTWMRPSQRRPLKDELNLSRLEKLGFSLSSNRKFLLDKNNSNEVIGRIRVVDTKYLFQWGEREDHQIIVANAGITKEHMSDILSERGQTAGKGFYVSMDPVDSYNYGDALTQFRTRGPLVILEFRDTYRLKVMIHTEFVERLGQSGFDALSFEGYSSTWLSMIHTRRLQGASPLSRDVMETLAIEAKNNGELRRILTTVRPRLPSIFWSILQKHSQK